MLLDDDAQLSLFDVPRAFHRCVSSKLPSLGTLEVHRFGGLILD
ncbi:hypothetical protein AWB78_05670 [Caballeronia calidae]|uniref:Uncharacterized protein n=1 Tax=Caballeronia calidae TaxID=1777139 RepID=A0A158DVA5_9BURK|nr:hypothetical protein AWB78_05670 [Caballeronia calidae]